MTSKIALVTGAGKRLGAEIAKGLGEDGHDVIVHYYQSGDDAEAVAGEIRSAGGSARAVQFNLADSAGIADFAASLGQIDILVNSASVFDFDAPQAIDLDRFETALKVNLMAPTLLASAMAAGHEDRNSGCVINLLDQKLFNLNPDFFSYTLSKAGLLAATRTMAMAFAPRVRVNGIAPGLTLPVAGQSEEAFRAAHALNPMEAGATPDDIVRAVRFILATPSMTGETLIIDGGEHLHPRRRDVMFEGKTRS